MKKTKFFVSCSSGIDYVKHQSSIAPLYNTIYFSEIEEYIEYKELNEEQLFQRLKLDQDSKASIKSAYKDNIIKDINHAISNKYERFIFIINSLNKETSNTINDIKKEKPELDIEIIDCRAISYPLFNIALKLDNIIKKEERDDFQGDIIRLTNSYKIFVYTPKSDLYQSEARIDYEQHTINADKKGDLYTISRDGIIPVKRNKNELPFQQFIKMFDSEINNKKTIPFILYTYKRSDYIKVLEKRIKLLYPKLEEIIMLPMPYELGINLGFNSIGVGYIEDI